MAEALISEEARPSVDSALSRSGWWPYIGTLLSLIVCYAQVIVVVMLPLIGRSWEFNPHLQAVLMWGFGLLSVIALYLAREKHGDWRPFYIGVTGLIIMIATLYTYYDVRILFLGYLLLLIGAFANQSSIFRTLKAQIELQASELANWNQTLENRVQKQVKELEKVGLLKRFLSPEVVELIVTEKDKSLLKSHSRYVAALFCDLRGFTAFSERTEPEEVIDVLQQYYKKLGQLVVDFGGTIDHRAGDGLMVFNNDPLPCDEPTLRATELAFTMLDEVRRLAVEWRKFDYQLGLGIGIAAGYATLGIVGDERRSDYTAIGNSINFASRLCDHAKDGEILVNQRAYLDVEKAVEAEEIDGLELKGVSRLQKAYSIVPKS